MDSLLVMPCLSETASHLYDFLSLLTYLGWIELGLCDWSHWLAIGAEVERQVTGVLLHFVLALVDAIEIFLFFNRCVFGFQFWQNYRIVIDHWSLCFRQVHYSLSRRLLYLNFTFQTFRNLRSLFLGLLQLLYLIKGCF
jgi:hypothetical protein